MTWSTTFSPGRTSIPWPPDLTSLSFWTLRLNLISFLVSILTHLESFWTTSHQLDVVPYCHERKSQKKPKSSSKFSNQRKKRIYQLFSFDFSVLGCCTEVLWREWGLSFLSDCDILLVFARFLAFCDICDHFEVPLSQRTCHNAWNLILFLKDTSKVMLHCIGIPILVFCCTVWNSSNTPSVP